MSSSVLKTISPVDGSTYAERELASETLIASSLEKSKKAQNEWRNSSIETRAKYCTKAINYFLKNKKEIAEEICWQMGRPIQYCGGEINGLQERANYMIDIAEDALKPFELENKEGFTRRIERAPLGTVMVMAPWNYPYLTAVNAIIPALMAGNTVLLKHSHQTPLCAERFDQAFKEAGLPEGVFQFLHLSHDQSGDILRKADINYLSFTGSVNGGKIVEDQISGRFMGRSLELGGKDPAYVCADADLAYAIEQLVDGAFFNSGQSCCGIERIYVHKSRFDDFVEGYVNLVKQYQLGDPSDANTTLGPLVNAQAAGFVREQITEAIKQGAKALIDTEAFSANKENSPYLAPQVLINVNHKMRCMSEESFGPVVGIMAVESDEEAIRLMNDSEFGLTASLWSKDNEHIEKLLPQVNAGTVFANRCDYLDPGLAWSGIKNSGYGCSLSHYGFQQLTRSKSIHIKHI